ncbi:MAG: alcohol dehydrogenase catalytic domain-containing protein [bacterium]
MRAAFCSAARRIDVRAVAVPQARSDEVVVRVRACGICGSDLHWFTGHGRPPRVCPGHEIAGEVVGLGDAVTTWREGDRVAIEPMAVCGVCRYCRADMPQLCVRLRIFGMHLNGGLAERIAVPASALFALPDGMDWAVAALAEPLAVAVHALRLAAIDAGQRVLVLGSGSVGLLGVLAARAAGAAEVWITARYPHQAQQARELGATRVFATTAEADAERRGLAGEHAVDAVIETVGGSADTIADALHCVRPAGTVVVLGVFTGSPPLPATTLLVKEARLVGSMMYDRRTVPVDFAAAIALLADHTERIAPLVTHRFGLDDVQRAFETAADKSSGAIKVCVAAA